MKRVATSLILIPISAWAVLAAPEWVFVLVILAVGLGAYSELDAIAGSQGIPRSGVFGMLLGAILLLAPEPDAAFALVVLAAMLFALRAAELSKVLPAASACRLGVVYIFVAWRCAREIGR